jgi:hypothetical protein
VGTGKAYSVSAVCLEKKVSMISPSRVHDSLCDDAALMRWDRVFSSEIGINVNPSCSGVATLGGSGK